MQRSTIGNHDQRPSSDSTELRLNTASIGEPTYPEPLLRHLRDQAPDRFWWIGDESLLRGPRMGWLSSDRLPIDLVLPALTRAIAFAAEGLTLVSGFHSPVERMCLETCLARGGSAVVVAARGIGRYSVPSRWAAALSGGRLMIASIFDDRVRRPTGRTAALRNRAVAALAPKVFVTGATAGGRLRPLMREIAARGQPLSCFEHPVNEDILLLGAEPISPG